MTRSKKLRKTGARPRTYARNRAAVSRTGRELLFETDSTYFLKLVLCVLLGTLWLKFKDPLTIGTLPFNALPVGLVIGFICITVFEKHQSDRKIWYAVLIVVTVICYFVPAGIVL